MRHSRFLSTTAICALAFATAAHAEDFNISRGDLKTALDVYAKQSGVPLMVSAVAINGARTEGVKGSMPAEVALTRLLRGTGFVAQHHSLGAVSITRAEPVAADPQQMRLAEAAPVHAASVETVVVTSSKIKGDIQTVPIAITALSQEQLTSRQIAGGPDLVKEVPNLTFSKTNFTGYNIEIRGIGTQAISVTTDPAVAVAFNDTAFIRNHFFEQEFYDVSQVEVLRGPQGTLYGRNATAGVVNVISAKPTDQFEAMLSADWGNYHNRRYEGMVNIPVVDDRLDIRFAGEWTKRDGYSFNAETNRPIDGRDLWSTRLSIGIRPVEKLQATLIWEHFQESDDRIRSAKQLCKNDPGISELGGFDTNGVGPGLLGKVFLSQGCLPTSLYGPDAFEVVNGSSLPYYGGIKGEGQFGAIGTPLIGGDPYVGTTQSRNLRVIESALDPSYHAKNDVIELNADYTLSPTFTLSSDTGYNHDFLYSTEDFNRFNTSPDIFEYSGPFGVRNNIISSPNGDYLCTDGTIAHGSNTCTQPQFSYEFGYFCDPQLGCSDRLVAEDLSVEHAWQLSQEFRLASNFSGPLNFSLGVNYLYYQTQENYNVFFNTLTLFALVSENCNKTGEQFGNPLNPGGVLGSCSYIDPNPISSVNDKGHNYFLSENPYVLNSYADFAEAYFQATPDLKFIGGMRFTDDKKHFTDIPSEILTIGWGYPSVGVVDQEWKQWTGRATANWTPKLDFTDQTLVYASYAHGYKAGGANPPGAVLLGNGYGSLTNPVHPTTFKPEFIDSYEIGTKNTLGDGALTLNATGFYYDYKGYQISEIVDRTAINLNFDATVKGAELETSWEPAPGLKFSFAGGYEDTRVANGQKTVDLMDRTAGTPGWVVVKPFVTLASNCVMPEYVMVELLYVGGYQLEGACSGAWDSHLDPVTGLPYAPNPQYSSNNTPTPGYPGFNYAAYPDANNGTGFFKNVGGNQLPNAPHFTTSLTAEYTLPVSEDWAATLHSDFYWQSQSFARILNDKPYDKIRGYSNVNVALILTGASGWQVIGYLKNVFNTTAITGDFLNSDDTGLTTNVFLTDPRLYGIRVTKNF